MEKNKTTTRIIFLIRNEIRTRLFSITEWNMPISIINLRKVKYLMELVTCPNTRFPNNE